MKKHNQNKRRIAALTRLKASAFFPKKQRTQEEWEARKAQEIEALESRIK